MKQLSDPENIQNSPLQQNTTSSDSTNYHGESINMLYDILVYREWPKTALDLQSFNSINANNRILFAGPNGVITKEGNTSNSSSTAYSWIRSYWPFRWQSPSLSSISPKIQALLDQRIAWKFSLSDDGSLLAVLQDHLLEIFSSKDNFATALGRIPLSKSSGQSGRDPYPSFRLLTWSPDSSLLLLTSSHGNVDIYDSYGFHIYSIFSTNMPRKELYNRVTLDDMGDAYVGAYFTDGRVKSRDWLCELILVNYSGRVNSFLLSPSGFQEFTSFSLTQGSSQFSNHGISCAAFNHKHNLLCTAWATSYPGIPKYSDDQQASSHGLVTWRLLNEYPFYVQAVSNNNEGNPRSWSPLNFLKTSDSMESTIYSLEESLDGNLLCALHSSGDISIWHLPSLRLYKLVPLEIQPGFDDMNPTLLQNPKMKRKKQMFLKNPLKWMPTDIRWWNNESIVITRYSGGVSIINLSEEEDGEGMRNILGDSSEFFSGPPQLSKCFDNGFFVLECGTFAKRRRSKSSIEDNSFGEDCSTAFDETKDSDPEELEESEEESDEESSLYLRGKRTLTAVAYLLTESERFAPPRKKPRIMMMSYKLLSLISTTPEELFARKIDMEEYGEALIMAQHYELDSDQVYDRQWRLSNLSVVAIKDYLAKIKRRSLVLKECMHTVPNDVEAVRELLSYGLAETGLDVLAKLGEKGNNAEDAKYIFPHEKSQGDDYESYYITEEEISAKAELKENELMDRVNWTNLTLSQKDMLVTRQVLLKYLHRLESYLAIIDECDDGEFDKAFYMSYREQPILKSAIDFARSGQIRAVSTVLERYGPELRSFYLTILSNFPESLSPEEYSFLIPRIEEMVTVLLPYHNTSLDRTNFGAMRLEGSNKADWSEFKFVKSSITDYIKTENDFLNDLTQDDLSNSSSADEKNVAKADRKNRFKNLKIENMVNPKFYFVETVPSRELVIEWVDTRAREIENESSLVDHALALLQIASVNGIQIDTRLHHNILTLEMITYDLSTSSTMSMLNLKRLEEMSDLEVVDKLMSKSNKTNFIGNVNKILIPYLDRLESLEAGTRNHLLRNYLLHMSATSLVLPFEMIKHGASTVNSGNDSSPGNVFLSVEGYVSIGIDCIYAFETNDGRSSPDIDDDDDPGEDKKESTDIVMELASFLRKRCRNPDVINELAEIITMVKAGKLLKEKYNIIKSLNYFRASKTQKKQMEDLLVQVTRRAEGKRPKLNGKDWFEVLQDLFELRLAFPIVPLHHCLEVLCESLLCSEETENIRLVEEIFDYSPADALFKGKSSMLYTLSVYKIGSIPQESKTNVVVKACEYYLDSSKDVDDPNLGLARHCLSLADTTFHKNEQSNAHETPLKKYYCLLTALDMLAEFGVSILPIVLRNASSNRSSLHQVMEKILDVDPTNYKNVRKILKLVRLLNESRDIHQSTEKSGSSTGSKTKEDLNDNFLQKKENENSVLSIIAQSAMKASDYDACFGICEILMDSVPAGNEYAVKACLELTNCSEFMDFQGAKSSMASFCVNYCVDEEIEDMLCHRIDLEEVIIKETPPREKVSGIFPMVPIDLQSISIKPAIPEIVLPTAAVEISKSVANVAIEKITSVPDRANVSAIPSAAVDISKSLATAVAAGTNVATETGTRAITSLFGRLGGVINIASSNSTAAEETNITKEESPCIPNTNDTKIDGKIEIEYKVKSVPLIRAPKLMIDSFYESVFRGNESSLIGDSGENSHFEDFSSNSHLSVDVDTLNLVSRHYRNALEIEEKEELEWSMLQDILLNINNEDVSIGASIILSELLDKHNKLVTIEESVDVVSNKDSSDVDVMPSDLQEADGWENDWSDPDLSGLSGDEEIEKVKQDKTSVKKTVNISDRLINELISYKSETKLLGTGLALYVLSLAVIIKEADIEPDIAFKISHNTVLAIARKYVTNRKKQGDINDENLNEGELIDLFVKTIETAKTYEF